MNPSRRTFVVSSLLTGLASGLPLLALPLPSMGGEAAYPDVILQTQRTLLTFDLGEAVARGAELVGLPKRHIRAWRETVGDRFVGKGLRAVDVLDDDPALSSAVSRVLQDAVDDVRVKLRFKKLVKQLDPGPGQVEPLIDTIATELVGLDVAALRAHRQTLTDDGLLIVYGCAQDLSDVLAVLSSHLMTLFLEAVHGRRATVVYGAQPRGEVLRPLLDPAHRVVAFVGHGHWNTFSTTGPGGPPDAVWNTLVSKLQADLKGTAAKLAAGRIYEVLPWKRGEIDERSLALLLKAWFATDEALEAAKKDLIVRHTCGTNRFYSQARFLWDLLPEEVAAQTERDQWGRTVASKTPEDEAWNEQMTAFLAGRPAEIRVQDALGTCLVTDPKNTRGYAGNSWLDDFVETPIPPPATTPAFVAVPEEASPE